MRPLLLTALLFVGCTVPIALPTPSDSDYVGSKGVDTLYPKQEAAEKIAASDIPIDWQYFSLDEIELPLPSTAEHGTSADDCWWARSIPLDVIGDPAYFAFRLCKLPYKTSEAFLNTLCTKDEDIDPSLSGSSKGHSVYFDVMHNGVRILQYSGNCQLAGAGSYLLEENGTVYRIVLSTDEQKAGKQNATISFLNARPAR